jgi:trk system potassium uptake protein TrkH
LLLLVLGAVAYGLTEWHFTLSELSPWDKVHNAWFQSVTLRTAGFNSVDLTATQDATQLIMVFFMFVGGSPGGTAGGIKTATLAIVLLTVGAMLTGRHQVVYRRRLIDQATVYKAAAVAFTGSLVAFVMAVALQLTQNLEPQVAIFEVVSALATVGLTIGGTSQLDSVGKLIVMACMFAGRVGPLTLFFFLTSKNASRANHSYPETKVDVG